MRAIFGGFYPSLRDFCTIATTHPSLVLRNELLIFYRGGRKSLKRDSGRDKGNAFRRHPCLFGAIFAAVFGSGGTCGPYATKKSKDR